MTLFVWMLACNGGPTESDRPPDTDRAEETDLPLDTDSGETDVPSDTDVAPDTDLPAPPPAIALSVTPVFDPVEGGVASFEVTPIAGEGVVTLAVWDTAGSGVFSATGSLGDGFSATWDGHGADGSWAHAGAYTVTAWLVAPDGQVVALLTDQANRTKSVVVLRPATL